MKLTMYDFLKSKKIDYRGIICKAEIYFTNRIKFFIDRYNNR